MAINDWPVTERPRERLLAQGPSVLSDAELLAIFLRSGTRGATAVDLGRSLISRFGSLGGVFRAAPAELDAAAGLGPAKSAQLLAAFEVARRALAEPLRTGETLNSPDAVRAYLAFVLASREHEVFVVAYLDAQNRVIEVEELFRGSLTQTSVYPREVVKSALRHNAAAVILAHNHPSGVPEPSQADRAITIRLRDALGLVDVIVLDHFIIGGSRSVSLAERGWV